MITEIKKNKYYSVVNFLDNTYNIENEVIFKYKISVGKSFTNEEFQKILLENDYYYYDRIAKNKLKKLLTTKELKDFLKEKNANDSLINELILKYQKFNYLNDEEYIRIYIESKKYKEGPRLIYNKLIEKGLDSNKINNYLQKLDESILVSEYIEKNISKKTNKTKLQISNSLKKDLVNKGFNYSVINDLVDKYLKTLKIDESKLIEKDFNKLYKKYKNKKENYELKQLIISKLLQKGYSLESINKVINLEFK